MFDSDRGRLRLVELLSRQEMSGQKTDFAPLIDEYPRETRLKQYNGPDYRTTAIRPIVLLDKLHFTADGLGPDSLRAIRAIPRSHRTRDSAWTRRVHFGALTLDYAPRRADYRIPWARLTVQLRTDRQDWVQTATAIREGFEFIDRHPAKWRVSRVDLAADYPIWIGDVLVYPTPGIKTFKFASALDEYVSETRLANPPESIASMYVGARCSGKTPTTHACVYWREAKADRKVLRVEVRLMRPVRKQPRGGKAVRIAEPELDCVVWPHKLDLIPMWGFSDLDEGRELRAMQALGVLERTAADLPHGERRARRELLKRALRERGSWIEQPHAAMNRCWPDVLAQIQDALEDPQRSSNGPKSVSSPAPYIRPPPPAFNRRSRAKRGGNTAG